MTAAAVGLEDIFASDAASGDAALTEEEVIACMADAGASLQSLKAVAGGHTGGSADNDEDWAFLLDALDAFDQPPTSGQSEAAALGQDQHKLKRQVPPAGLQRPIVGPSCAPTAAAPSTALHSNSPPAMKAEVQLQAASVTASGEADSNSAVAAAGWGSNVSRFSWAEDNSTLLGGAAGRAEAVAALSAGNSHSPGSAGGAHSSAGPTHRATGGGTAAGNAAQQQQEQPQQYLHHQQQHQPAGSRSGPWATDMLGPVASHTADRLPGMAGPQPVPFSHAMSPQRPDFMMGPTSSSSALAHHQQPPQQLTLATSSALHPPYRRSLDFLEPRSRLSLQGGMAPSGSHEPLRPPVPLVNHFAVPGSPLSGSPLANSLGHHAFARGDVAAAAQFVLSSGPQLNQPPMMQQHPGRAVVTGGHLHHNSSSSSSRGPWASSGCPCCPPGRQQHHHTGLLGTSSGAMLTCPHPQLPEAHSLVFSPAGDLEPDWRPGPHSMPLPQLELDMGGRQLPAGVPHYHLPPPVSNRPGHGHHLAQLHHMAPSYSNQMQQMGPTPTRGAGCVAAPPVGGGGAARAAGAAAAAAGGPLAPELGDIHPAALSQFGVPEETFPVMVGPPKRKRGRPRKHPLPEVAAAAAAIAAARGPTAATAMPPGASGEPGAAPAGAYAPGSSVQPQLRHHLVMQHQQQQQQMMLLQQHQRQLHLQQQQQRQMMLEQRAVQPWPSETRAAAGDGNPWAADGPGFSQAVMKRQKGGTMTWPLGP